MPVQRLEDFTLVYNTDVISVLGIEEDEVLKYAESIGIPSKAVTTVAAG